MKTYQQTAREIARFHAMKVSVNGGPAVLLEDYVAAHDLGGAETIELVQNLQSFCHFKNVAAIWEKQK